TEWRRRSAVSAAPVYSAAPGPTDRRYPYAWEAWTTSLRSDRSTTASSAPRPAGINYPTTAFRATRVASPRRSRRANRFDAMLPMSVKSRSVLARLPSSLVHAPRDIDTPDPGNRAGVG